LAFTAGVLDHGRRQNNGLFHRRRACRARRQNQGLCRRFLSQPAHQQGNHLNPGLFPNPALKDLFYFYLACISPPFKG